MFCSFATNQCFYALSKCNQLFILTKTGHLSLGKLAMDRRILNLKELSKEKVGQTKLVLIKIYVIKV